MHSQPVRLYQGESLVKPHANKSIQYKKLIGNQPLFHNYGLVNFYFGVVNIHQLDN